MDGRNVLARRALITQTAAKRTAAAAIASAKVRNNWSNSDAADALGCSEGTIRNRLDPELPNNQMTIHELLRSIQCDPAIANDMLALADHKVVPVEPVHDASCDRSKQSRIVEAVLMLSVALEEDDDGVLDPPVIRANQATLENARDAIDKLLSRIKPRSAA